MSLNSTTGRNITLLAASSLTVMAGAIVAPSLPAMGKAFSAIDPHGTLTRLVLTVPALSVALIAPLSGWLVDRLGRKRLLLFSILLYVLAGTSGAYLPTIWSILVGRAILGLAVAGIMISATTLIGDYFTGPARGRFLGLQGAFMALGGVVFLTGGGMLAEIGWRMPFLVYALALPLFFLGMWSINEPVRDVRSVADTLHSHTKSQNNHLGTVSLIYLAGVLSMMVFYLTPVQIPFHLEKFGGGGLQSGLAIAASTLSGAIAAFAYGRIGKSMGVIGCTLFCFALMGVGYGIIAASSGYLGVLIGLVVSGFGSGLNMPNLSTWLLSIAPEHWRGRLTGGLTACLFTGQFLSPLAAKPFVMQGGTTAAFVVAAGLSIFVALLLGVKLFQQPRPVHA